MMLDDAITTPYSSFTMKIAIVYGSTTGKTQAVATLLQGHFPGSVVLNVAHIQARDLTEFEVVLLGTSTWATGALQNDWLRRLPLFPPGCLKGKNLAFFGLGDKVAFPDTFCHGMHTLQRHFAPGAVRVLGGEGLSLDDDNHHLLTEGRVAGWADKLKEEGLG